MRKLITIMKIQISLFLIFMFGIMIQKLNLKFINLYGVKIPIDYNQIYTLSMGLLTIHATISILVLAIYQITLTLKNEKVNISNYYNYIFLKKKLVLFYRFYEIFIIILGSIFINIFFALTNNLSALISTLCLSTILIVTLFYKTVNIISDERNLRNGILNSISSDFLSLLRKEMTPKINVFEENESIKVFEEHSHILFTAIDDIKLYKEKKEIKKIKETFDFLIRFKIAQKDNLKYKFLTKLKKVSNKKYNFHEYKEIFILLHDGFLKYFVFSLHEEYEEGLIILWEKLRKYEDLFFNPNSFASKFFDINTMYDNYDLIEKIIEPYKNEHLLVVVRINDEEIPDNYDKVRSLKERMKILKKINWEQLNSFSYYHISKEIITYLFYGLDRNKSKYILEKLGFILDMELKGNKIIKNKEYVDFYTKYILKVIDFNKENPEEHIYIHNRLTHIAYHCCRERKEIIIGIALNLIKNQHEKHLYAIVEYLQEYLSYEDTSDIFMYIIFFLFEEYFKNSNKEAYQYKQLMEYKIKHHVSKFDKNPIMSIYELINNRKIMKLIIYKEISKININTDEEYLSSLIKFYVYYISMYDEKAISNYLVNIKNDSEKVYILLKNVLYEKELIDILRKINSWCSGDVLKQDNLNSNNIEINLSQVKHAFKKVESKPQRNLNKHKRKRNGSKK
ncbi:MAG: hypothetical protein E7215_08910 [Clostridium sulfidigenes]|uniref:Uncharacterized protein n=1 Tax=Clostridium sulfidigenes TaxID=318464 RepID=A0A927W7C1_9CLOT|nr:hypothetical protein [Clostridium sulfidigenes]